MTTLSLVAEPQVRVWDGVAGHYTLCHSLSRSLRARLVKAAWAAIGGKGMRRLSQLMLLRETLNAERKRVGEPPLVAHGSSR